MAKRAIFEFIEVFYNRRRRHSSLGNLTPAVYEERKEEEEEEEEEEEALRRQRHSSGIINLSVKAGQAQLDFAGASNRASPCRARRIRRGQSRLSDEPRTASGKPLSLLGSGVGSAQPSRRPPPPPWEHCRLANPRHNRHNHQCLRLMTSWSTTTTTHIADRRVDGRRRYNSVPAKSRPGSKAIVIVGCSGLSGIGTAQLRQCSVSSQSQTGGRCECGRCHADPDTAQAPRAQRRAERPDR